MTSTNAMSQSDEIGFWRDHLPRPLGYQPAPAPEHAPVREPGPEDVAAMDMSHYAAYRSEHVPDRGDFFGLPSSRPRPTPNE